MLQPYFDQLNNELAHHETIKKFAVLPKDLTVDDGELTPSMKLKRKFVEKKFKNILDEFYAGAMADKG
jgi:long-chain acyl-CoA synthetase